MLAVDLIALTQRLLRSGDLASSCHPAATIPTKTKPSGSKISYLLHESPGLIACGTLHG